MRIEVKLIEPPPPAREVVISMSGEDARNLLDELVKLRQTATAQHYTVNRLMNALCDSRVQAA